MSESQKEVLGRLRDAYEVAEDNTLGCGAVVKTPDPKTLTGPFRGRKEPEVIDPTRTVGTYDTGHSRKGSQPVCSRR